MPKESPYTSIHDSLLPMLYASDQDNGWGEGMRAVTRALLACVVLSPGAVLEVGCGGGQLLADIQRIYPTRLVAGTDLHPLALAHARGLLRVDGNLAQSSLPDLPWEDDRFALLLALDVFDQQGVEMAAALAEAHRLLMPGGLLLLRVSAHPWLYGAHDLAFHTGQRYTRLHMHDALLHAGFAVERLTYANMTLSMPVVVLRLAQRWGLLPLRPESYRQSCLRGIVAWILRQEARWLHHADLPWGLSLCAVARKPDRV